MAIKDITGEKFGRLTVVSLAGTKLVGTRKKHRAIWNCQCDCGGTAVVTGASLRSGNTKSCGCLLRDITVDRCTSHGNATRKRQTKEYTTYLGMRSRCENPNSTDFADYMARGIYVCERWVNSFANFLSDMGKAPSAQHSIDRIDNDGPYSPENCRWALPRQQARNKRSTRYVEAFGKRMSVAELSEVIGKPYQSILYRINHNIPLDDWLKSTSIHGRDV